MSALSTMPSGNYASQSVRTNAAAAFSFQQYVAADVRRLHHLKSDIRSSKSETNTSRIFNFRRSASVLLTVLFLLSPGFAALLHAGEPALSSAPTTTSATTSTSTSTNASAAPAERPFTESDFLELLTATLQKDYVKDRGELELRLTQPWKSRAVPAGPITLKVLELPNAGVTASFIVRFELLTSDQSLGTWQVPAQARIWREIWIARSVLKRGMLLTEADLARERRDMLTMREQLADFTPDDLNLEFAEPLQVGSPVLARSLRPRPIVHRGQMAEALVQAGALNISMKVEVLEDGALGQMVRARNPVSLRNVRGKVVAEQTIEISL